MRQPELVGKTALRGFVGGVDAGHDGSQRNKVLVLITEAANFRLAAGRGIVRVKKQDNGLPQV